MCNLNFIFMRKLYSLLIAAIFCPSVSHGQTLQESFEQWPPQNWTLGSDKGEAEWQQTPCTEEKGPGAAADGEKAAFADYSTLGYVMPYMITPTFDVSALTNPEISFSWFHKGSDKDNGYIEVLAGYEENGEMVFKSIGNVTTTQDLTEWQVFRQVFNKNVKQIKLLSEKSKFWTQTPYYIDNVIIQEAGYTAAPINLTYMLQPDADGKVKLAWQAINDESKWNVKIAKAPFDPATADGDIKVTGIEGTPETIVEGLVVGQTYYWYVQTADNADGSAWVGASFKVDKAPLEVPFALTFNESDEGFAFVQDGQVNQWFWGEAAAMEGKAMYVSNDGGANNVYDINEAVKTHMYRNVLFPADMKKGAMLSFDFRGVGTQYNHCMKVFLVEDMSIYPVAGSYVQPKSGITTMLGKYNLQPEWTHYDIEIPASYAGKQVRMIISWENNDYEAASNPPAAFDNLMLTVLQCETPKNVEALFRTSSSVTLDWDMDTQASMFEIEYGSYGFEPGTGTVVAVDQLPPYTVTGLEESTRYDFFVRALCSDDMVSDDSQRLQTYTETAPKQAPYSAYFDEPELEKEMFPLGWSYTSGGNHKPYVLSSSFWAHSQPNCMAINDPTGEEMTTLVSPQFTDIAEGNRRITFYARISGMQHLIVGVMSDNTDANTFVPLKRINGADYPEYDPITGMAREGMYKHFLNLNDSRITAEHKYIAFRVGDILGKPLSIDDFVYEEIPANLEPTNVHPVDVSNDHARFAWDNHDGVKEWEVVCLQNGSEPDETTTGFTVTEPVALIDGLHEQVFYSVFVRAIYDNDIKSQWSQASVFLTCSGNPTLPFMEDFDNMYVHGMAPQCWSVDGYETYWALTKGEESSYPNAVHYAATTETVDSWMFTPAIYLEKDKSYMYSFWTKAEVESSDNTLAVCVGQEPTANAMGEALINYNQLSNRYKIVKAYFTPTESAFYFVGTNLKGAQSDGVYIDDVMLDEHDNPYAGIEQADNTDMMLQKSANALWLSHNATSARIDITRHDGVTIESIGSYAAGTRISTTGWAPGIYMVKATVGKATKMYKVVIK